MALIVKHTIVSHSSVTALPSCCNANKTQFKLTKHSHAISLITITYLIPEIQWYCLVFILHWQKSFANYQHHTNAEKHGFSQRIKQANY